MQQYLVITIIGDDRPGIVEKLSALVCAHGGNWLECSMAHLAGKFAGILRVAAEDNQVLALQAALGGLAEVKAVAELAGSRPAGSVELRRCRLLLVGQDRPGIVKEVAHVLASRGVNVETLESWTDVAAMAATPLFHAEAVLALAAGTDLAELQNDLERIADDLMVDISLAAENTV
ncbi:MAG: ACT domain-containing protein [Rhodocyclaceae bacterium]|nr:ACT domain-containing protein [Rhodocyclaceae bacterium]